MDNLRRPNFILSKKIGVQFLHEINLFILLFIVSRQRLVNQKPNGVCMFSREMKNYLFFMFIGNPPIYLEEIEKLLIFPWITHLVQNNMQYFRYLGLLFSINNKLQWCQIENQQIPVYDIK